MNVSATRPEFEKNGSAGVQEVHGEIVDIDGDRYYAIHNVDAMSPFFISVVSNDNHWLFVSSNGGLTAGRVSPDYALFPYMTVDKIHDSALHTGCRTLIRCTDDAPLWEPFNAEHDARFRVTRNIYKNLLGNKLRFEEINHDLDMAFRYTWTTSGDYGFVRYCELENLSDSERVFELIDGLQNILPAGTPRIAQTNTSSLVDAYKWTELEPDTGLALFTLYSGISDRAEPCESLRANTVFSIGLDAPVIMVSNEQLPAFRRGATPQTELHKRGIRGAYFVYQTLTLAGGSLRHWKLVANVEQSQTQTVALLHELRNMSALDTRIAHSIDSGSDALARIIASADGFQATAEPEVSLHHYANVLFNVLRGGIFDDSYQVTASDLARTIREFNHRVYLRNRDWLAALPETIALPALMAAVATRGDAQLERLCGEYLPIRFGRRHGDPSRPWNQFAIRLQDDHGNRLLSYEGNWRDIFQNWEALVFSYPEFIESVIAKFVNASTMDGYNPYRITKEGIDWEVEEPDDLWSYIGYWGDHQIIYLLKLLELSRDFHPAHLHALLHKRVFCYANVPYRIKPFESLLEDPKDTVSYDNALAELIEHRVADIGADGKLVLDADGQVYLVTLLEKLLVPLLSKLGNLVVDGGIWMNTQRPEWNDANNALVGYGLSMVTLYYMRRYVTFLQQLLATENGDIELSEEVGQWLEHSCEALAEIRPALGSAVVTPAQRYRSLEQLGTAASHYRQSVYAQGNYSSRRQQAVAVVNDMLDHALAAIDHTIANGRDDAGLYHAYNLLHLDDGEAHIDHLYPMLEGQVAALSAGAINPEQAAAVIDALFASDVYRKDQQSFMLYPDRELPGFLDKNVIAAGDVAAIPLLAAMQEKSDTRLVMQDDDGRFRFRARFTGSGELQLALDELAEEYGELLESARAPLAALYEKVFNHRAFTGRSGGMFGFEGLGSIYWHMVAKLLLAVQENYHSASAAGAGAQRQLGQLYYRVREGIGFNKTPAEYGAFPTDPYSHTPRHAGAQQPGMTGQVKEEVLTRFGELGVRVSEGRVRFEPGLLRAREFLGSARELRYLDIAGHWQTVPVPARALAFTWCQVPVSYKLDDRSAGEVTVTMSDDTQQSTAGMTLPTAVSDALFRRDGSIRHIQVCFATDRLFGD